MNINLHFPNEFRITEPANYYLRSSFCLRQLISGKDYNSGLIYEFTHTRKYTANSTARHFRTFTGTTDFLCLYQQCN